MRCERIVQVLVTMLLWLSLLPWLIVAITVSLPIGLRSVMDQGLIQARRLWCRVRHWSIMGERAAAVL